MSRKKISKRLSEMEKEIEKLGRLEEYVRKTRRYFEEEIRRMKGFAKKFQ